MRQIIDMQEVTDEVSSITSLVTLSVLLKIRKRRNDLRTRALIYLYMPVEDSIRRDLRA